MSITHDRLVREATDSFAQAGIPNPRHEARRVAALTLADLAPVADTNRGTPPAQFADVVRRRSTRVPLERLVGSVPFRSIELFVGDGVFVPQPETSPVVQWCVDATAGEGAVAPRIADLCTGSGTIALCLANEIPLAEVHAVELSPEAFAWAKRNAEQRVRCGDSPVVLHLGDVASALHEFNRTFDLVASNPPYVADHELADLQPEVRDHDPRIAIHGGRDGLDLVRRVERAAHRLLRDGGLVVVEHSDRQGRSAPEVFEGTRAWVDIEEHQDNEGRDRFVTARRRAR